MKKADSLHAGNTNNRPACLTLVGRCFQARSSYQPDSESESEGEGEGLIPKVNQLVDGSVNSNHEITSDFNQQKAEIVREDNNDNRQLLENGPKDTKNDQRTKDLSQNLSISAQEVINSSIQGIGIKLGVDSSHVKIVTDNTSKIFEFTSSLEEKAMNFTSQLLGSKNNLEESGNDRDSSEQSAESTPRLSEFYLQESAKGEQGFVSKSETQVSEVELAPSAKVHEPVAQTIRSVTLEDPNFPNELKIRAFDYINKAASLDYNISPSEKPNYFDYSMGVISQKSADIKAKYSDSTARAGLCLIGITENKNINNEEKIKLFDLINAKVNLPVKDDKDKIDKLIFIIKAIKFKKNAIKGVLDRIAEESKKSQRALLGP